jgi:hypothetical protein
VVKPESQDPRSYCAGKKVRRGSTLQREQGLGMQLLPAPRDWPFVRVLSSVFPR